MPAMTYSTLAGVYSMLARRKSLPALTQTVLAMTYSRLATTYSGLSSANDGRRSVAWRSPVFFGAPVTSRRIGKPPEAQENGDQPHPKGLELAPLREALASPSGPPDAFGFRHVGEKRLRVFTKPHRIE